MEAEPNLVVIGTPLSGALEKLRWSATGGEFSAAVSSVECTALLDHIVENERRIIEIERESIRTVDPYEYLARPVRSYPSQQLYISEPWWQLVLPVAVVGFIAGLLSRR